MKRRDNDLSNSKRKSSTHILTIRILVITLLATGLGWSLWSLQAHHDPMLVRDGQGGMYDGSPYTLDVDDTSISLEHLQQIVGLRSALIVDARPSSRYRTGHIPGAINFPASSLHEDRLPSELKRHGESMTVVVYCESPTCSDSEEVASYLRRLGINRVLVFEGGWEVWRDQQGPLEVTPA